MYNALWAKHISVRDPYVQREVGAARATLAGAKFRLAVRARPRRFSTLSVP